MSKGGSTTTTSNKIDPALMALANQNYASAQAVANRPYQAYTGEGVAPTTAAQTQSYGLINNIAANNPGAGTLNSAISGTQNAANYTPSTVTAGQLSNTDLSSYLNPYTNDVINTTMSDLERQRQTANMNDNQAATSAGAFGGSRSGVANALTNDAYDRNTASTLANLNSSAYTNAQSSALQDIANRLTADTSNQNAGLSGASLNMNANANLANMSNDQLNQASTIAGLLNTSGTQQQQQQQSMDDYLRQQFLDQWNYPLQQQNIRSAALGLIPQQSTQTSNVQQTASPLSILGNAASMAAMFV